MIFLSLDLSRCRFLSLVIETAQREHDLDVRIVHRDNDFVAG